MQKGMIKQEKVSPGGIGGAMFGVHHGSFVHSPAALRANRAAIGVNFDYSTLDDSGRVAFETGGVQAHHDPFGDETDAGYYMPQAEGSCFQFDHGNSGGHGQVRDT